MLLIYHEKKLTTTPLGIRFEQSAFALNALSTVEQSFKTSELFAKAVHQIIFIVSNVSKQFNNHSPTLDKVLQQLNKRFQQYGKAVQQKHMLSTVVIIF